VRAGLWDPIARHLQGARRVFVVPDGVVHRVNFAALPDAGGRYLADSGPLVHRLAAERDLLPVDEAPGSGLLALGGADFDRASDGGTPWLAVADVGSRARSTVADSLRVRFDPLPQTAAEVADVATLWRAAGSGEVVERTGAEASEAAFKTLAPTRRVLHVATHGFALGRPSNGAAIGTRGIGGVGAGERAAPRRATALLPGLALAGANVPQPRDEEDGFLTAEEITSLDLTGAEWAVLSACETGLGDPDAAEAVQGLHRSFRRAGVRTVIMSLWMVDDQATRAWMQSLYAARLERKADTATAVQAATRASLADRRARGLDTHPFRWAAFIASGDWR
jgi:CHAT domain-containing protein